MSDYSNMKQPVAHLPILNQADSLLPVVKQIASLLLNVKQDASEVVIMQRTVAQIRDTVWNIQPLSLVALL